MVTYSGSQIKMRPWIKMTKAQMLLFHPKGIAANHFLLWWALSFWNIYVLLTKLGSVLPMHQCLAVLQRKVVEIWRPESPGSWFSGFHYKQDRPTLVHVMGKHLLCWAFGGGMLGAVYSVFTSQLTFLSIKTFERTTILFREYRANLGNSAW